MFLRILFGGIIEAKSVSFLCWKQWLKRKWAGSWYCYEGRAPGLCITAGYLKFLVSLETQTVIPIGACVSMMSYNLQISTMDLLFVDLQSSDSFEKAPKGRERALVS